MKALASVEWELHARRIPRCAAWAPPPRSGFSISARIVSLYEGGDMNHHTIDEGPILGFLALAIALAMMLAA